MSETSFIDLPIEILHRIFDHLDVRTVIGSVRGVSKRFYGAVNSYNHFQIDLRSGKKPLVETISRLIESSNVTSLILSDGYNAEGLIELFLKAFDLNKFKRLRSLTLYQINDNQAMQILQDINIDTLVLLTIDKYERLNNGVFSSVSSLIVRTNLQKLYLTSLDYSHNGPLWPTESRLQHLTIRDCTYHGYHIILRNLLYLRTLKIRKCTMNNIDEPISLYTTTTSNSAKRQRNSTDSTGTMIGNYFYTFYVLISVYTQLKSLSIGDCDISIQELERLLSLIPSLEHLKLVSLKEQKRNQKFDGLYWEQFIQNNLRLLNKFQFYFTCEMRKLDDVDQLMPFILSFQSSFWLTKKHCSITCDYIPRESKVRLYTTPISKDLKLTCLALQISSTNPSYCATLDSNEKVSVLVKFFFFGVCELISKINA